MDHIMIDIETLSRSNNAAILSIGAVAFDPYANKVGAGGYYVGIDVDSAGLGHIEGSTVKWWMNQSDSARQAAMEGTTIQKNALLQFGAWLKEQGVYDGYGCKMRLWANDPDFDLVILENAYERHGLPCPWNFTAARSCRTVADIARMLNISRVTPAGTAHNALDDAIKQANEVGLVLSRLLKS